MGKLNKDKEYKFKIKDIAAACSYNRRTVERAIRRGVFNPHDIADVARYIIAARLQWRITD